jgi:hypothetical protein
VLSLGEGRFALTLLTAGGALFSFLQPIAPAKIIAMAKNNTALVSLFIDNITSSVFLLHNMLVGK